MSNAERIAVRIAEQDETYAVKIRADETVDVTMEESIQIVQADMYDGDYIVIPKAHEETILETRDKTMTDNVTVRRVPYYETHSETGTTVFIASEV